MYCCQGVAQRLVYRGRAYGVTGVDMPLELYRLNNLNVIFRGREVFIVDVKL